MPLEVMEKHAFEGPHLIPYVKEACTSKLEPKFVELEEGRSQPISPGSGDSEGLRRKLLQSYP